MLQLHKYYSTQLIKIKNINDIDKFPYIKSSPFVIDYINVLLNNNDKILDVGSGIGEFMLLLKIVMLDKYKKNIDVKGIEVDNRIENYIKIPTIFIDAFDYNEYNKFDVLYMYQPYSNIEKMLLLIKHIQNSNCKIIYNNDSIESHTLFELNFVHIQNNIWYFCKNK